MPAVETISLTAALKWFFSVILIPFIWLQHKAIQGLKIKLAEDYYKKNEVKEQIEDKLAPLKTDLSWIRKTMEKEYGNK